ncbi:MAG: hypothetical protein D6B27_01350, partial [Gammaproteobacteria bacterium]
MSRILKHFALIAAIAALSACGGGGGDGTTEGTAENKVAVKIARVAIAKDGAVVEPAIVEEDTSIVLSADVSENGKMISAAGDTVEYIQSAEFLVDGASVGLDQTPPYRINDYVADSVGIHELKVKISYLEEDGSTVSVVEKAGSFEVTAKEI